MHGSIITRNFWWKLKKWSKKKENIFMEDRRIRLIKEDVDDPTECHHFLLWD